MTDLIKLTNKNEYIGLLNSDKNEKIISVPNPDELFNLLDDLTSHHSNVPLGFLEDRTELREFFKAMLLNPTLSSILTNLIEGLATFLFEETDYLDDDGDYKEYNDFFSLSDVGTVYVMYLKDNK